MNSAIITGNLGKEPELRMTQNGKPVCSFSVAVRGYNNETKWFNVKAFGKVAENVNTYCRKGSKVGVIGSMNPYQYDKKDGTKAYEFEILANNVEFLSVKEREENTNDYAPSSEDDFTVIDDTEDLPF